MDVIANIDRTIDGEPRRAGERFTLPDDTDLIALGVVRAANPPAAVAPEAAEDYPPGYQGLRRAPKAADEAVREIEAVAQKQQEDTHPDPLPQAGEAAKGRRKRA